ncbi:MULTISPECIES: segregation and condensation protein A [Alteromonadaceae]|uniref:segregation and condensation protein A n=1 Tax=Alteromonadaceae TaxID=72275 RepID=UPI001C080A78|nr:MULTISPECIES: ScpA family protein [Aliiglaciecola]MBU2878229.1 segregation/condensation protein A [Aliiglaciecola lipolytica]MDO6711860.1 ScpA family protein [Aliiglaciecola sp. 2_MG-2023]MDO6752966.1 ScpA family protein [Aliiglaciecola sp. 1_MG-2023]
MTQESAPNKAPIQQPLPLAFVNGEAMIDKPEDLYIPPDALEVILEAFEGPLDLLLYLIRKQKFDIVNLPVLQITQQYMEYVEVMKEIKLELAAEYLLMAAILAEVKSRLLLPKRPDAEEDEDDPRAELIRRLQEYEAIKLAAQEIDGLPRMERDLFSASATPNEHVAPIKIQPEVNLQELVLAFQSVMKKAKAFEHHQIEREVLSTRERMSKILELLDEKDYLGFETLFFVSEGKAGVVVTFLAILELVKESLVELVQAQPFSQIHLKLRNREEGVWQD